MTQVGMRTNTKRRDETALVVWDKGVEKDAIMILDFAFYIPDSASPEPGIIQACGLQKLS